MPFEGHRTKGDFDIDIAIGSIAYRPAAPYAPCGHVEQDDHLLVARWREVAIVVADRHEPPRHRDEHDLIGLSQIPDGLSRSNRPGPDHLRRAEVTSDPGRHPHRWPPWPARAGTGPPACAPR